MRMTSQTSSKENINRFPPLRREKKNMVGRSIGVPVSRLVDGLVGRYIPSPWNCSTSSHCPRLQRRNVFIGFQVMIGRYANTNEVDDDDDDDGDYNEGDDETWYRFRGIIW